MKKTVLQILLSASCLLGLPAWAAPHIHVMLLDGESAALYHNWPIVTQVLKKELDEVGLFDVDVVTAPPAGADFSNFKPEWSRYQVIVFNYDAPEDRWSADLKASFEKYVRDGGGLVTVHASDNAFNGWEAYNEMIGVGGWRDAMRSQVHTGITKTASSHPMTSPAALDTMVCGSRSR